MAQYPSCALRLGALDAIVRVSKRRHVSTHRSMAMAAIDSIPESEIYRHIVEQTKDYAVFVLDTAGRVVTWNEGASASRATTARRSSASTSACSTRPRTGSAAGPRTS